MRGAERPLLSACVLLALQTLFLLNVRELFFPNEVRYANVMQHLFDGKWLVLYLNSVPYPDKPPGYFLVVAAVGKLFSLSIPVAMFLATAFTAVLLLYCTSVFARIVLRLDKRQEFIGHLMVLTNVMVAVMLHHPRMDIMFAGLIIWSLACFYRAWEADGGAYGWMLAGSVLTAMATFTKGPLAIAFPLLGSVLFLLWNGRLRRLLRADVGLALAVMAMFLGVWGYGILVVEGRAYFDELLYKQVYQRTTNSFHHKNPWFYYLAYAPIIWLPWSAVVLTVPVKRLFASAFWKSLRLGVDHDRGTQFTWITVISGSVLLSAISIKITVYLLPLVPLVLLLAARHTAQLDEARCHKLFGAVAMLFMVGTAILPILQYIHPWPIQIRGLWLLAALGFGLALLLHRSAIRTLPGPSVLHVAVGITIWSNVLVAYMLPSLNPVLSPKAQAEVMREYIAQGYAPVSTLYSGTYNYYADALDIYETYDLDKVAEHFAEHPKAVVAVRDEQWEDLVERTGPLRHVHEQWIEGRYYYLGVQGPD